MARILIVEDDLPFAESLAFMLRVEGHEVAAAATAEEGLQKAVERCPDVVIADWMLRSPIHGGELCRRIASICPNIRSIIITGYLNTFSEIAQWSNYADAIIEKPFHKTKILEAVDRAMAGPHAGLKPPHHYSQVTP